MTEQKEVNVPGYTILVIGVILSLFAAFVPHFTAGYRLNFLVFVTGMLPYLVYGIAVPLYRSGLVTFAGVIILVIHAWLVFELRIIGNGEYTDDRIYFVPMAAAIAAVPVAILAMQKCCQYSSDQKADPPPV